MFSGWEWKPFVLPCRSRAYAISVWTLRKWVRVKRRYEFLWLVHDICLRTRTFYAAIFTVKQGGICFQLFIYESVCLTANMELFSLEWRISVQPWECQMYLCRHEFDFMGKGKGKLACSWTAGQSMKSDLLKLIWAQEKDHVNEALVKT